MAGKLIVRAVDYVGNPGGGVRFAMELLRALAQRREIAVELVSHGPALDLYRTLLDSSGLRIHARDVPPRGSWRNAWAKKRTFSSRVIQRFAPKLIKWHFEIPPAAFSAADVVWFPWAGGHRFPARFASNVVGSFHDAIIFDFPELLPRVNLEDERKSARRILGSEARIVVSSHATAATLNRLFGVEEAAISVIPLSGQHSEDSDQPLPLEWAWAEQPFLLCPANVSAHKNHEVLLAGVARAGFRYPLVLTGHGTDFTGAGMREKELGRFARDLGFDFGRTLLPLGYISNEAYFALLRRARAVVMPTLAEGGGSFPVWEALVRGVPVLTSDIPVIREQMQRVGGKVLWFDPHDPSDLTARLNELDQEYESIKRQAAEQIAHLHDRSWAAVAEDYLRVFREVSMNSLTIR